MPWGPPSWIGRPWRHGGRHVGSDIVTSLKLKGPLYYSYYFKLVKHPGELWVVNFFKGLREVKQYQPYFFRGSFMYFLYCVCYAFVCVCLFVPCGHLLGKGWPLGSQLWCLTVSLSLSHWYSGSGVVLDCIDSWSLHPYLFWIPTSSTVL